MNIASNDTLVSHFHRTISERADLPALHLFRNDAFASQTWREFSADVHRYAAALADLGIQPGDRVVQISENRHEWLLVDLAVHLCQAVHVALHASLTGPQLAEQILDCEPKLIIVSSAVQLEKLNTTLPIVSHEDGLAIDGIPVPCLGTLAGAADPVRGQQLLAAALAGTTPDTLATILYTSGTTGEPKGVMLTHGNLASNALACVEAFRGDADNRRLCWLPLSHIYARTSDLYVWIAAGSQMALARSRDTLVADLALVHPTFINGVPYFYDKLARFLRDAGKAEDPGALAGLLGGQMRVCCAGGAALSDETARFFERQGVLLVQGYGLTEAAPVISTCTRAANRIGTVGPLIEGVEARIAEDGELLIRGPNVMPGYWKKPEATAEAIRDGWLHTGDLATIEEGLLRITGRKKEIIVLSSGKNIAPALIERQLCDDPLIAQAMVVGDNRNYLCALVVPDAPNVKALTSTLRPPASSLDEVFRQHIDQRLACLSPQEQIARFCLLDRSFTVERDELTPTLKLRRRQIAENFAQEIDAMYAE